MSLYPDDFLENHDLTFEEWLEVTLTLEREGFKQDPPALQGDARADFFESMGLAAITEISEMMQECGYKRWTQNRGWINRDHFISEAADSLHFIALLLAAVGCTGEELTAAYLKKVNKNYKRQSKGDDGVSRVCSHCKRSLDDVGVNSYTRTGERFCGACGTAIPMAPNG